MISTKTQNLFGTLRIACMSPYNEVLAVVTILLLSAKKTSSVLPKSWAENQPLSPTLTISQQNETMTIKAYIVEKESLRQTTIAFTSFTRLSRGESISILSQSSSISTIIRRTKILTPFS